MKIRIQPTIYSKFQTIEQVRNCLDKWPYQNTNNPMAYEYSIEFIDRIGGPVGTLSEFEEYDEFEILLKDGIMNVRKIYDFYFAVDIKHSNIILKNQS